LLFGVLTNHLREKCSKDFSPIPYSKGKRGRFRMEFEKVTWEGNICKMRKGDFREKMDGKKRERFKKGGRFIEGGPEDKSESLPMCHETRERETTNKGGRLKKKSSSIVRLRYCRKNSGREKRKQYRGLSSRGPEGKCAPKT